MKINLLEILDDYPIELEGILDNSYVKAPVYYDYEEQVKNPPGKAYPGHEEAGLKGKPTLYLDGEKTEPFPDELKDTLVEWIQENAGRIGSKKKREHEMAKAEHKIEKMQERRRRG